MKRLLFVSILTFLVLAATASAAPVTCATSYTDLATSPMATSTGCMFDGLVFSNFQVAVSSPPGMTVGLANLFQGAGGVMLDFSISGFSFTSPTVPDLRIVYEVTGGLFGVDANLSNATAPVSMNETVCNSAGVLGSGGACAGSKVAVSAGMNPLYVTSANSPQAMTFATPQSNVWIVKDITAQAGYSGPASISEFVNSQAVAVPEPTTFAMLGGGLLLFAFARRKKA